MICEKCGAQLNDDAKFCTCCGNSVHIDEIKKEKIKSHMTAAILTTVFLGNWILGIPSIVFAKECQIALNSGQREIAERFSRRAMSFMCIGSALSIAFVSFIIFVAVMTKAVIT